MKAIILIYIVFAFLIKSNFMCVRYDRTCYLCISQAKTTDRKRLRFQKFIHKFNHTQCTLTEMQMLLKLYFLAFTKILSSMEFIKDF